MVANLASQEVSFHSPRYELYGGTNNSEFFFQNGPFSYVQSHICLYVGMYVGLSKKIRMPKCVGKMTWPKHAHAQSQFCAVKINL